MTLNKQMKELVESLRNNTVVSVILPGDTNVNAFKRKLSVVKTRANVEGKLDFSIEELSGEFMLENYGTNKPGINMTVVLIPYQDKTQILAIKTGDL